MSFSFCTVVVCFLMLKGANHLMRPSKSNLSQEIAGRVISEVFAALRDHGIELDLPAMTAVLARVNGVLTTPDANGPERRHTKPPSITSHPESNPS